MYKAESPVYEVIPLTGDDLLFAHGRVRTETGAIPRESFSETLGATGPGNEMPVPVLTLYYESVCYDSLILG